MDVSEFLRLNAQESSLHCMRQLQRSSGDGEACPTAAPAQETPLFRGTAAPYGSALRGVAPTTLLGVPPQLVPASGDLAGIKSLTPYNIDVAPQTTKILNRNAKHRVCKPAITKPCKIETEKDSHLVKFTEKESKSNMCKLGKKSKKLFDADTKESSPIMNKVSDLVKTLPRDAVISPLNVELLNSPPSSIGDKAKTFMCPRPPGVPYSKHSSIKYTQLTRKHYNEPKFIPYEPYRGCTASLFNSKTERKVLKKSFALTSQPALPQVVEAPLNKGKAARAKLDIVVSDFESERQTWDKRVKGLTVRCEQAEQQLSTCNREKIILEDQLNVQARVNGELKKLLVASVGEDVQGRVHCLTEDKARMANMIRRYSEKLDRDYEERERMAILCDVWKSKFLASSVLVEELGSWKAALLRWTSEAAEALSVLLDEMALLRTHGHRAYRLVGELVAAFDPLHSASSSAVTLAGDGVSVGLAVADQAHALHQRLLGPLLAPPPCVGPAPEARTPGEQMAVQVLERRDICVGYPGYAGGTDGPRVPPGHPMHTSATTALSHMTVNCCAHCNGEIQCV